MRSVGDRPVRHEAASLTSTGRWSDASTRVRVGEARQVVIDFEDVLLLSAAMLADDASMARGRSRASTDACMVDEYQDVSAIQQRLLDQWLGDRDDLTVVGDPNQMIYSFAGASSQYLRTFRAASRRHP